MWPAGAKGLITQWFCLHFPWFFEPAHWVVLPSLLNEQVSTKCDHSSPCMIVTLLSLLIYYTVSVWCLECPVLYNIKTELGLKCNLFLISSRMVSCLWRTRHWGCFFPPYPSSPKHVGEFYPSGSRGDKNGWKVPIAQLHTLEARQTLVAWSLCFLVLVNDSFCSLTVHSGGLLLDRVRALPHVSSFSHVDRLWP